MSERYHLVDFDGLGEEVDGGLVVERFEEGFEVCFGDAEVLVGLLRAAYLEDDDEVFVAGDDDSADVLDGLVEFPDQVVVLRPGGFHALEVFEVAEGEQLSAEVEDEFLFVDVDGVVFGEDEVGRGVEEGGDVEDGVCDAGVVLAEGTEGFLHGERLVAGDDLVHLVGRGEVVFVVEEHLGLEAAELVDLDLLVEVERVDDALVEGDSAEGDAVVGDDGVGAEDPEVQEVHHAGPFWVRWGYRG